MICCGSANVLSRVRLILRTSSGHPPADDLTLMCVWVTGRPFDPGPGLVSPTITGATPRTYGEDRSQVRPGPQVEVRAPGFTVGPQSFTMGPPSCTMGAPSFTVGPPSLSMDPAFKQCCEDPNNNK